LRPITVAEAMLRSDMTFSCVEGGIV
jgi:hypothetical protein